jgi:SAM-dependent methyltransferase
MDAPDIDPAVYAAVLADLSRVNRWTFTAHPTLRYLERAAAGLDAFTLLDVGFGHGDMLRAIARWARKRGIRARLIGVDLNPLSEKIAKAATSPELGIAFRTGDYRNQPEPVDFIISCQVAHHMSEGQLDEFLRYMEERSVRGWLISDLNRHTFSHSGYPLLARIMGVHRIVRQDGTLSIARAIRPKEWPAILSRAGIDPGLVAIRRRFPFRVCVERIR